jgi:hypothetical protein
LQHSDDDDEGFNEICMHGIERHWMNGGRKKAVVVVSWSCHVYSSGGWENYRESIYMIIPMQNASCKF